MKASRSDFPAGVGAPVGPATPTWAPTSVSPAAGSTISSRLSSRRRCTTWAPVWRRPPRTTPTCSGSLRFARIVLPHAAKRDCLSLGMVLEADEHRLRTADRGRTDRLYGQWRRRLRQRTAASLLILLGSGVPNGDGGPASLEDGGVAGNLRADRNPARQRQEDVQRHGDLDDRRGLSRQHDSNVRRHRRRQQNLSGGREEIIIPIITSTATTAATTKPHLLATTTIRERWTGYTNGTPNSPWPCGPNKTCDPPIPIRPAPPTNGDLARRT